MIQNTTEVFLTKATNRELGIQKLLTKFDLKDYARKEVALKANFNSADPFPASTHPKTLEALVKALKEADVDRITLFERSGMGSTRDVLTQTGVFALSEDLGFEVVVLDDLDKEDWVKIKGKGTHWRRGFYIPKLLLEANKIIQTCCLKTHRFGGHFTLSLKNSVGIVAKKIPEETYDYMQELHTSSHQRHMIAEINRYYDVDLVIMDATKAFINMGPEQGEIVEPNLILASNDRIAIDMIGVAIMRSYGSTKNVMKGKISELDQIRRAMELGIGVKSPSKIQITPLTKENQETTENIRKIIETQA